MDFRVTPTPASKIDSDSDSNSDSGRFYGPVPAPPVEILDWRLYQRFHWRRWNAIWRFLEIGVIDTKRMTIVLS